MFGRLIRVLPWIKPKRRRTGGFSGLGHFFRALTDIRIERGVAYFQDDGLRVLWLASVYRRFDGDIRKTQEYLRNEQVGEISRSRILVAVWLTRDHSLSSYTVKSSVSRLMSELS